MTSTAVAVTVAALLIEADVASSTRSTKAIPLKLMPEPLPAVGVTLKAWSDVSALTSTLPALVIMAPAAIPAFVVFVS